MKFLGCLLKVKLDSGVKGVGGGFFKLPNLISINKCATFVMVFLIEKFNIYMLLDATGPALDMVLYVYMCYDRL